MIFQNYVQQFQFEISLVVFMPNITTNHAITYTNNAKKVAYCYFTTRVCGIMFKFPGGFKRKIGWQKWQGTTLQNVNANPPAINNWKHTKHRLPILFYISSTEVKYKLYSYILKRVKIKPRNVFTKTVNFSCYFKLFSISVKHLFRCQRNQSYCKIVLLSATRGVSIILWGPV